MTSSGDAPAATPLPVEERYLVTPEAIVRYAGASGDFTSIHYDHDVADAAGYDRLFAMGMLAAGHLGTLLVRSFGDGSVLDLRTRFRARSWVGDEVRCHGEVLGAGDDGDTLRVVVRAVDEHGSVLVEGDAVVRPAA